MFAILVYPATISMAKIWAAQSAPKYNTIERNMKTAHLPRPLPMKNGIRPSYLVLPHDAAFAGKTLLAYLCARYPFLNENAWAARLDSGFVTDSDGLPLSSRAPFQGGAVVYYYRETSHGHEPEIPFAERIIHTDGHLIVVDKPHFLPVIPSGRFLHETLLSRLRRHPELQYLDTAAITPIHRLDKDTAGVMLFSRHTGSRAAYQNLFQNRQVRKTYEALAPFRRDLHFPVTVESRIEAGEPFYLSRETDGQANARTVIELIEKRGGHALYRLYPETGKKHQLRLHMMRLGIPILNDMLYPEVMPLSQEDYGKPLKLLARRLEFTDPFSGETRVFESTLTL